MTLVEQDEPLSPLDVMANLVLEDGNLWGDQAAKFQVDDAKAIFDTSGPLWHFLTRPRGGSKTTDLAGVSLSWLVAEARPLQKSYVVATAEDQAGELLDAAAGFILRTPLLYREVSIEASIMYGNNGSAVQVLTSEGSSAWGKGRDTGFLILDEFAQWPETKKMKKLWVAMISATQKTPDLRMVILTSAGEPGHMSYGILKSAKADSQHWHVSEVPGPVPWVNHDAIEAQRGLLTEPEHLRLHYNVWTEDEDRLLSQEDWENCAQLDGDQPYQRGKRYVVTVDIGVKVDPTCIAVTHAEPMPEAPGAKRIIVDRLIRFVPRRNREVNLALVKKTVMDLSTEFGRAPIWGDPSQFLAMKQDLSLAGYKVKEFKFSPTSVGEIGSTLVQACHNVQVYVPDREELRDELLNVRLRTTSPGVYRLDHDEKRHDDQAVTIGMGVHILLGKTSGIAAFKQYMERRKARSAEQEQEGREPKRQEEDELVKFHRQLMKRREARDNVRAPRCDHRWRQDGTCVWGCEASNRPA